MDNNLIGTNINKYYIIKYIASGSYGNVYEAIDKKTDIKYALKIPVKNDKKDGQKSILDEYRIYKRLSNNDYGIMDTKLTKFIDKKILVMDLLGDSLEQKLKINKRINLKDLLSIAINIIDIIKYIHSQGYIHRDIKPNNFVYHYSNQNKLYCIDFGLTKKYLKKNGEHIEFSKISKFCGTARYASIAAHNYNEQSRKDDLESIGYMLVYLYKGFLPWQNIKIDDKKKHYEMIGKKKQSLSEEFICKDMPKEFCVFLKYVRTLDFDEKPHYTSLKNMFIKLYDSLN